jgi:pimeloyl-ACP methyl ester carboxylesterase
MRQFAFWGYCIFLLATAGASTAIAAPLDGACPNPVLNDQAIHVRTPADVVRVRTNLINYIWGQDTLPTGFDELTVTPNVVSPFACDVNLAQVDRINLAMGPAQNGTTINGWAWHFTPVSRNNQLVIVHDGHMGCSYFMEDESGLSGSALGIQMTVNALLRAGYDVLFVLMPLYVPDQCLGDHALLFQPDYAPPAGSPIRYFLDTTLQSLNYLESSNAFEEIDMIGLSGGGWTTTLYAALDPRIMRSFPVAGSIPLYLRGTVSSQQNPDVSFLGVTAASGNECNNLGDQEQNFPDLYSIAGYPDLYVLGSYGAGREQVQILNRNDSCCFGQAQEANPDDYDDDIRTYEFGVRKTLESLDAGHFRLEVDEASTHHQISRRALHGVILAELKLSRSELGAASGAHAFKRGYNGHLWENDGSGWSDLGFRIAGKPAVLEGAAYPLQVAVRNAQNEPEFLYSDGSRWHALLLPDSGLPALPYGQGKIVADPRIISTDAESSDVVGQGVDFNLYHWHVAASGTTFEPAGGSEYGVGIPALSVDGGALSAIYRSGELTDPDSGCVEQPDVMYQLKQNPDGTWQTEQRLGGMTQTFPVADNVAGGQRAYVLGEDNGIWEFSDDVGQWEPIGSGTESFAGSPGKSFPVAGGKAFYVRTSDDNLGQFVYDTTGAGWNYYPALDLGSGDAPESMVDSPLDTPDGVYWTGRDGQIRFYDGSNSRVLNAVDTLFRDDFEGVLSP